MNWLLVANNKMWETLLRTPKTSKEQTEILSAQHDLDSCDCVERCWGWALQIMNLYSSLIVKKIYGMKIDE